MLIDYVERSIKLKNMTDEEKEEWSENLHRKMENLRGRKLKRANGGYVSTGSGETNEDLYSTKSKKG